MGPKPILFCSHVTAFGGAETVLTDLLQNIDRRRFAPHLASPPDGALPAKARELGVPVHPLPLADGSAWRKLCRLPRAARTLRAVAAEIGAPLLYANTMIAGYAAVLARHRDLACLWHLHIVTRSRIARFALRRADGIVTPSRAGAGAVDPKLTDASRLSIVANGVAAEFFAAKGTGVRESLGLPATTLLVGIVGRLDPHKGHEVLLRAMAATGAHTHLVIVGEETFGASFARVRGFANQLRELATSLGVGSRTHFLGQRQDVAALLSQFDVVAVPSTALESAPRTIAEAQAAGTAVIGSRIGGIPELIADRATGLLCAPGSVDDLARGLRLLLESAELRDHLGAAARRHAEQRYRIEHFVRGIEDACERTIAHAAARRG